MLDYRLTIVDARGCLVWDLADGHTPKQRAIHAHNARRAGAVPSQVIAFLTMVEHYSGMDDESRVHMGLPEL